MKLVIIAFREIGGGIVGVKLTEAEVDEEPATERETRNARAMAESLAKLLSATEGISETVQ